MFLCHPIKTADLRTTGRQKDKMCIFYWPKYHLTECVGDVIEPLLFVFYCTM